MPRGSGPYKVIAQLGIYGFDEETKRLRLISLHSGLRIADVKDNSNLEIIIPDKVETSPQPTEDHLRILREEIHPAGVVLGNSLWTLLDILMKSEGALRL